MESALTILLRLKVLYYFLGGRVGGYLPPMRPGDQNIENLALRSKHLNLMEKAFEASRIRRHKKHHEVLSWVPQSWVAQEVNRLTSYI